jgi:hypothetical protein
VADFAVCRFAGTCPNCGWERECAFRGLPANPQPLRFAGFGGPEPSKLLDAGEWLAVAQDSELDEGSPAPICNPLEVAVAAVDEILKFIPEGSDSVPDEAFWTERGRAVRAAEPECFTIHWLMTVRVSLSDTFVLPDSQY